VAVSPQPHSVIKKQICFTTSTFRHPTMRFSAETHHDCNLDLKRTIAKCRQLLGEAAKGTVAADPNDPRRVVITELR
jgi:hypothetical protein